MKSAAASCSTQCARRWSASGASGNRAASAQPLAAPSLTAVPLSTKFLATSGEEAPPRNRSIASSFKQESAIHRYGTVSKTEPPRGQRLCRRVKSPRDRKAQDPRDPERSKTRRTTNLGNGLLVAEYGYSQMELANHLDLHNSTISRIVTASAQQDR